ncbi:hypothetical protein ANTHONY_270 [Bacillus phage Anthony]|uniref:Uncharacterized protein n=1 Tax=Bacillus phage Anthony TaxID=2024253 RepID=A0A223LGJ9_9CAUD|nr:hypothetical protein ANTHONY_270 [Bacillus phage Anthony]
MEDYAHAARIISHQAMALVILATARRTIVMAALTTTITLMIQTHVIMTIMIHLATETIRTAIN